MLLLKLEYGQTIGETPYLLAKRCRNFNDHKHGQAFILPLISVAQRFGLGVKIPFSCLRAEMRQIQPTTPESSPCGERVIRTDGAGSLEVKKKIIKMGSAHSFHGWMSFHD